MAENSFEENFQETLSSLNLKTKNQAKDNKQLKKILFNILRFPSLSIFQKHDQASSLGRTDLYSFEQKLQEYFQSDENERNLQVCQCCGHLTQNQNLNCFTSLQELKLKPNIYFFFKNYQFIEFLFLLQFVIYYMFCYMTTDEITFRKNGLSPSNTSWMILLIIIVWWILNVINKEKNKKHLFNFEKKYPSVSSFTIMISNFPKAELNINKNDNLTHFQELFNKLQFYKRSRFTYKVEKVNIAKSFNEISKQKKKINESLHKEHMEKRKIFKEWIKHRQNNENFPISEAQRNKEYENYDNFYHYQYKEFTQIQPSIGDRNVVFVTLSCTEACDDIVKKTQPSSWKNCWNFCQNPYFPVKRVRIERAPEPQEIVWQNNYYLSETKFKQTLITSLIGIFLIAFSFALITIINYSSEIEQKQILRPLVITITNYLIQEIIFYVVKSRKYFILSNEYEAIFKTIVAYQIINTSALSILIVCLGQGSNADIFYIGLFNLIYPIYKLVDPSYNVIRRFKLWKYKKGIERIEIYGQKQLNKVLEKDQFNFGFQYVYLINTSIFTALFSSTCPILLIFAFVGTGIYYIASKYNLFYHSKRPKNSNPLLSNIILENLIFLPLIYSIGNLLFLNEEQRLANWLIFTFTLIMVLTMFSCLLSLCVRKKRLENIEYDIKYFETDYDLLNPSTKLEAFKQYEEHINLQEQNLQLTIPQKINKFKIGNRSNQKSSSPRAHMKVTKQMSYLNPKYAEKLIQEKKMRRGSEALFSLNLQSVENLHTDSL